jgi:hypothetical protein
LDISAPDDLRSSCDRNSFYLFCGSRLLFIRLASAACLYKFTKATFCLKTASDGYGTRHANQIVVVNPRTLEIVDASSFA